MKYLKTFNESTRYLTFDEKENYIHDLKNIFLEAQDLGYFMYYDYDQDDEYYDQIKISCRSYPNSDKTIYLVELNDTIKRFYEYIKINKGVKLKSAFILFDRANGNISHMPVGYMNLDSTHPTYRQVEDLSILKITFFLAIKQIQESFTFGDLEEYAKHDLEDELTNYKDWYEFWEEEDDDIKTIIKDAIKEFKSKVPIFDVIHVQPVKNLKDNIIGMYSHGSILRTPIIFLGIQNIYEALQEYDVGLEVTIRSTIFHELGHAIVDVDNHFVFIEGENILQFESEEIYVEDFAFELEIFGTVNDPNILKLADLFKNQDPLEINDFV